MLTEGFVNPKSIAVIGASSHPQKIGFSLLKNIIDGGFKGKIYPINPNIDNILAYKTYNSVLAVEGKIDLAVIVVPANIVSEVLIECGKKRIENVIIISAGFGESGADGLARQEAIKKIAELYKINILGPNCLGFINTKNKLNVSFSTSMPKRKNVAVVSQSGATCTAILDWANQNGIGFSTFVSLGNKIDLDENDFLEFLEKDKNTEVVLSYLESISEGERLISIAREITKEKPLIVLKAGRTAQGQIAASSHTGALAGDDSVIETAFNEVGIIRAESIEDLFELANVFSNLEKDVESNEILLITNAGGPAVMAADAISSSKNLDFYKISKVEKEKIIKKLPFGAKASNPLDLLGDATSKRFEDAILGIKNDNIYKILILTPQANTDINNISKVIAEKHDKRTVVVLVGGEKFTEARRILAKAEVPVFSYPERAVRALDFLVGYNKFKNRTETKEKYIKGFKKVADKVFATHENLNDGAINRILTAYNIPMADSYLTTDVNEAVEAAEKIGYPVVLKVTSPDILHKTEYGAVKLGIENEESLRSSYQEVLKNAKKNFPKAEILGVTVYKMVRSKVEVAIGAKRDKSFGPVIMFGLGGIYIELLKDYQLALGPISIEKALEMVRSIKAYELLAGYRNGEHFDVEAIAKAVSGLSALMEDFPNILEIDINPLRVGVKGEGVLALDAKMILEKKEALVV